MTRRIGPGTEFKPVPAPLYARVIQKLRRQRRTVRGYIRKLELPRAITFYNQMFARHIAQAWVDDDVAGGIAADNITPHVQFRIVAALIDEKQAIVQQNAALMLAEQ